MEQLGSGVRLKLVLLWKRGQAYVSEQKQSHLLQ